MSYRADKLGDGRTDWRADAGNDNTRRQKLASGNETALYQPTAIKLNVSQNPLKYPKDTSWSNYVPIMLHHFVSGNDIVLDIMATMLNYRDESMKTNTNAPPLESMLSKLWFQIAVPYDMSLNNRYETNMLI